MSDDFFLRLERQLEAAELRELNRGPAVRRFVAARRRLSVPLAAAAAVGVVVVVLAFLGAIDKRPQPVGTVPAQGKQVVATDLEAGIRFSVDGRVLTVHLLPSVPRDRLGPVAGHWRQARRRVSGARTSLTCGASPPGASGGATTLTQHWPAGQTSLSYRFRRDVSKWCRLEDPAGRSVAFVVFPGAGALATINDVANAWVRPHRWGLNPDGACPWHMNQGDCEGIWFDAAVQEIAIKGDHAAVRFSNGKTIELHGLANGEWRVSKVGENAGRGYFK